MAAPVSASPPAKRKKEDPTRLETSPALPATAAAAWSALPPDLVHRVADSLLATNDLDCYMHFRAVCPGWRAATDNPKDNTSDRRFEPRRWIVLDEVFQSEGKEMLLLNADTGRFLRRKLPLLRDHYAVATTQSGYLVLADKKPPHAASVLNPLTGAVIRFLVPLPPQMGVAGAVVLSTESRFHQQLLVSHAATQASPDSQSFTIHHHQGVKDYNFILKAAVCGGVYTRFFHGAVLRILFKFLMGYSFPVGLDELLWSLTGHCLISGYTHVGLDEQMLLVFSSRTAVYPRLLRFDTGTCQLVLVKSIGRFAIFIGHRRCLAVDADKFPGIEANCVYFTQHLDWSARILSITSRT